MNAPVATFPRPRASSAASTPLWSLQGSGAWVSQSLSASLRFEIDRNPKTPPTARPTTPAPAVARPAIRCPSPVLSFGGSASAPALVAPFEVEVELAPWDGSAALEVDDDEAVVD